MFLLTLGLIDPTIVPERKQEKGEDAEQFSNISSIYLRNYRKRFQSVQQLLHQESINPKRVINTIQRTMESLKYQTSALQNAAQKAGYAYKKVQVVSTQGNEEREEVTKNLNKVQQENVGFDVKEDNLKIEIESDDSANLTNPRQEKNNQKQERKQKADQQISDKIINLDGDQKNDANQENQENIENDNEIQIEIIEMNEQHQQQLEEVKIPIQEVKEEGAANKAEIEGDYHSHENIGNECSQDDQPSLLGVRQIISSVQQLYSEEVDSVCNISEDTCLTAKYSSFRHMLFALFENCLAHSHETNLQTSLKFMENPEQRLLIITMTIQAQPGSKSQRQQLISPERQELFLETNQSNFSIKNNKDNKESENNNNNLPGIENNNQNSNNNLLLRYLNGVNHEQVQIAEQEWLFSFLEESKCKHTQLNQKDFSQLQLEWNADFDDSIPKEYLRDSEQAHHQTQMMQQEQLLKISSDTSSFLDNIQEDENNFDLKSNLQNHDMAEIKAQKGKIQQNAQKYQEKLDLEYNKSNQLNLAKNSDRSSSNKVEIITFQERETKQFRFEQESEVPGGEFSEGQGNKELKQNNDSLFSIQKLRSLDNEKQELKKEEDQNANNLEDEYDYDMQFLASGGNKHYDDEFFSETKSKAEQKELNPGISAYNTKFKTIQDCPH